MVVFLKKSLFCVSDDLMVNVYVLKFIFNFDKNFLKFILVFLILFELSSM